MRVVAVAGDSIMTEAGPYPSALRKGDKVTTRSVMRFSRRQAGRLHRRDLRERRGAAPQDRGDGSVGGKVPTYRGTSNLSSAARSDW